MQGRQVVEDVRDRGSGPRRDGRRAGLAGRRAVASVVSAEATMTNETGRTRRTVLGGLAAGAGMMSMSNETTAQAQSAATAFVLVHGGWRGGWAWRRVSDLLEKKGHKVFTPTMTGLGE